MTFGLSTLTPQAMTTFGGLLRTLPRSGASTASTTIPWSSTKEVTIMASLTPLRPVGTDLLAEKSHAARSGLTRSNGILSAESLLTSSLRLLAKTWKFSHLRSS